MQDLDKKVKKDKVVPVQRFQWVQSVQQEQFKNCIYVGTVKITPSLPRNVCLKIKVTPPYYWIKDFSLKIMFDMRVLVCCVPRRNSKTKPGQVSLCISPLVSFSGYLKPTGTTVIISDLTVQFLMSVKDDIFYFKNLIN